jgi:hypothetical protein
MPAERVAMRQAREIIRLKFSAGVSTREIARRLEVTDWLPDYPGQTGERKTREFAARTSAEVPAWWKDLDVKSEDNDK